MKTALVTGAGRGIGLAAVRLFLKHDFQVLGLDRDFPAGIPKLVASLGEIHVLVNNAGIQNAVPIERYTDEMRSRILRVSS